MLQRLTLNSLLLLTLVYSTSAFAGRLPPPEMMCYWNCTDAGYSERECIKACKVPKKNSRFSDELVNDGQTQEIESCDTEIKTAE